MRARLGLLFLFLLFHLSFAGLLENMQYILPGTIVIVIAILALVNMLSSAINMPQVNALVKTEIRELIVAAVLVVIVFVLFHASTNIIAVLSGVSAGDVPRATQDFFKNRQDTINSAYEDTMQVFHQIGIKSGFSTSLAFPVFYGGFTGGGAPFSGYGVFFTFLSHSTQGLSTSLFLYTSLKVMMNFFLSLLTVSNPSLLFLAFTFRFIPFTRQLGNTLIALAIGAGVLLPFSVVLLSEFHNAISMPIPDISDADLESKIGSRTPGSLPTTICDNFLVRGVLNNFGEIGFSLPVCLPLLLVPGAGAPAFSICFYQIMMPIVYPLFLLTYALTYGSYLAGITYAGIGSDISATFDVLFPFFADVVKTVTLSYIDLVVIGLVVITGTKGVSSALGGEAYLVGLQRLL